MKALGSTRRRALLPFAIAAIVASCSEPIAGKAPSLALSAPTFVSGNVITPAGQVFTMTTVASDSSNSEPVEGVIVAFASPTIGATISPTTGATDATGTASTFLTVPFNSQAIVEVSVGNVINAATVSADEAPFQLSTPTTTQVKGSSVGEVLTATTQVTSAEAPLGVEGFAVTFASPTAGVTVAPSSVTTDATGHAQTYVTVPYNAQAVIQVSGAGKTSSAVVPVGIAPFQLSPPSAVGMATLVAGGEVMSVSTTLTSTDPNINVAGVTVSFTSPTSGVTIAPASAVTNSNGVAQVYATMPFDAVAAIEVAAGGTWNVGTIGSESSPILLSEPSFTSAGVAPSGALFIATTKAVLRDSQAPVEGIAIAFSSSASGVSFSPASAVTDATGKATSYVTVPFNSEAAVVVSGAGSAASAICAGSASGFLLSKPISTATGTMTPTAEVLSVTTQIADKSGLPVEGVAISFSSPTASVTITPATVVSDPSGNATTLMAMPFGSEAIVEATGGGALSSALVSSAPAFFTLSTPTFTAIGMTVGKGEMFSVATVVTDKATSQPVAGASVAFATTTNVSFSPVVVLSDATGTAMSYVTIPMTTSILVVVSSSGVAATTTQTVP